MFQTLTSRFMKSHTRPRTAHSLLIVAAAFLLGLPASELAAAAEDGEGQFLSRTRRLVFEGKRSGEGYFSPDGTQMVFQAEREEGNPFYQIYLMDMTNGDTRLVSPGHGKTTCAFIQPGTGRILYSSTHHDPKTLDLQKEELDFRASGQERRYSWDYDPEMEIYLWDPETKESTRLTNALGYDAEGSISPDGEWVVFASMRQAYERELSETEKKQFEIDPAYFSDLYVMKIDGSELKKVTDTPGYDGGPFFFPDGSRIIWRRFDESGLTADVWSAKPDGSDAKRHTNFGAMSWAPYVHPSGDYILFASNKLGFSNFEVFMVDVAGKKEPVRVTYADGFDGLPVPTPDGKQLVWTSGRHGGKGAQLYVANWNHEAALEALSQSPPRTENAK